VPPNVLADLGEMCALDDDGKVGHAAHRFLLARDYISRHRNVAPRSPGLCPPPRINHGLAALVVEQVVPVHIGGECRVAICKTHILDVGAREVVPPEHGILLAVETIVVVPRRLLNESIVDWRMLLCDEPAEIRNLRRGVLLGIEQYSNRRIGVLGPEHFEAAEEKLDKLAIPVPCLRPRHHFL
jgi:hypothetical protein